jgi:ribosomal protein S18 acetylase RimI-like enzyme
MSKLATAPTHRGQGLGAQAVREALAILRGKCATRVCLDCVHGPTGALVRFYEALGFASVDRRVLTFPTGEFDMVLMSCPVHGATPAA